MVKVRLRISIGHTRYRLKSEGAPDTVEYPLVYAESMASEQASRFLLQGRAHPN